MAEEEPFAKLDKSEDEERSITVSGDKKPSIILKIVAKAGAIVQDVSQKVNVYLLDEQAERRLKMEGRWRTVILALFIVVVAAAATLFAVKLIRDDGPEVMPAGFYNIAVPGFAEVGDFEGEEAGIRVAQTIKSVLESNMQEVLGSVNRINVWGPDEVGSLDAADSNSHFVQAKEIAHDVKANLVIFGEVQSSTRKWQVTPYFLIYSEHADDEIAGQHQFGKPIPITPATYDLLASDQDLSDEIAPRARLLVAIAAGLSNYTTANYDRALEHFKKIEDSTDWDNGEGGGKELLYLLMGNTHGRLEQYDEAEKYYQFALNEDDQYSRALIGLANLYYLRALEGGPEQMDWMDKSAATYQRALTVENQPEEADIESKVHFGLGQLYTLRSFLGEPVKPAVEAFDQVIAAYEADREGASVRLRELAGESHAGIGLIYQEAGYLEVAEEEFRTAAELLEQIDNERADSFTAKADEIKQMIANGGT